MTRTNREKHQLCQLAALGLCCLSAVETRRARLTLGDQVGGRTSAPTKKHGDRDTGSDTWDERGFPS